ncbi:VOC family protein [Paractinoplanes globisporus]|jgi:catechol 2,3-dioxygenase-like lactoylglutathione lyase family enzyme|uniref:VOC family protein n=1 Tax=Paractinoplanes globisporus TaxID=113565 RepID=A0ABW6WF13_9ACTN|nr:VOC family protein [Actinoplanes globisporus]
MAPSLNGIGLAVADMATSLTFYRRLGLDFPAGAEDGPHAEAELPGGIRLMLDTHASISSFDPSHKPGGPIKDGASLAFLCADPAEVNSQHADLVAAGHTNVKDPWDAPWGQRYAILRDPDGYQVELFAWTKN